MSAPSHAVVNLSRCKYKVKTFHAKKHFHIFITLAECLDSRGWSVVSVGIEKQGFYTINPFPLVVEAGKI